MEGEEEPARVRPLLYEPAEVLAVALPVVWVQLQPREPVVVPDDCVAHDDVLPSRLRCAVDLVSVLEVSPAEPLVVEADLPEHDGSLRARMLQAGPEDARTERGHRGGFGDLTDPLPGPDVVART